MNRVQVIKMPMLFKPCRLGAHAACPEINAFDPRKVCSCECHEPKVFGKYRKGPR